MQPPLPSFGRGVNVRIGLVDVIHVARELISELMAEVATRLELVDPMILGQHSGTDAIALRSRTWEQAAIRWRH